MERMIFHKTSHFSHPTLAVALPQKINPVVGATLAVGCKKCEVFFSKMRSKIPYLETSFFPTELPQ